MAWTVSLRCENLVALAGAYPAFPDRESSRLTLADRAMGQPAGFQPAYVRLEGGCLMHSATVANLVGSVRVELTFQRLKGVASTIELRSQNWCAARESNPVLPIKSRVLRQLSLQRKFSREPISPPTGPEFHRFLGAGRGNRTRLTPVIYRLQSL